MEISSQTFSNPGTERTFRSYVSMIDRCYFDKRARRWRELDVCEEWLKSFESFVSDMGFRPEGTTLDRIDNDRGYFPDNCRWATHKQQSRNRSNTVFVEYKGAEFPLSQLCEELGADYELVRGRLKVGMSLEDALEKPKRSSWMRCLVKGREINVAEYCREHGLDAQRVRDRLRNGWAFEDAVSKPKYARNGKGAGAAKWASLLRSAGVTTHESSNLSPSATQL